METEVVLRTAGPADGEAILAVERACPTAASWPRADYDHWLSLASRSPAAPSVIFLVADDPVVDSVVGFLLARTLADELEILNLAVEPAARRQGLGRRLLEEAWVRAARQGARHCWLEVRASNSAALRFYRGLGFREQQRRPHYYRNPTEDAVLCGRSLPGEPPGAA